MRQSENSFIGHITEQALAELRADMVIMGIRAISLDQGLTNDYLPETMTDRAIMGMGKEAFLELLDAMRVEFSYLEGSDVETEVKW